MLDAIHEADLTVYDFHQVDEYLWRQASRMKSNTRWVWKPLREKDSHLMVDIGLRGQTESAGYLLSDLYARRVPMKVLADMKAIMEKMPDAVFLVSDFEVIKPDPFLAVTTQKLLQAGKLWIIDQWDEPGFGAEASVVSMASVR